MIKWLNNPHHQLPQISLLRIMNTGDQTYVGHLGQ